MRDTASSPLPVFADEGGVYRSALASGNTSTLRLALLKAAPDAAFVLEFLVSGRGLSDQRAAMALGILDLSTQIKRLRNFGVSIRGEWHQDKYHDHFLVYRYSAEGHTGDEQINHLSGTHVMEDEGGPPLTE